MPFTPSHAAAVLPFIGRAGLVPVGLVIGSMAPDLPYYLQLGTDASLTHTVLGVATVDLLMGLIVFVAWQALVAPATYAAAPTGFRARANQPAPLAQSFASASAAGMLIASLVIGGLTHVLWDTFTHVDRWGTDSVPWLTEQNGRLPGYRWLQYASSLLGLVAIAAYLVAWWRRTPAAATSETDPGSAHLALPPRVATAFWGAIVLVAVAVAVAGLLSAVASDAGLRRGIFRALVWGGGAGMLALLIASAMVLPQRRRSGREAQHTPRP